MQPLLSQRARRHYNRYVCSVHPPSQHSHLPGVLVLYLALKGLTKACILVWGSEGFISGVYGHPPRIRLYVLVLTVLLTAHRVLSAGYNNSASTSSRSCS